MGQRLFDESISIGQVFYMIAYEGWRPPIPEGCPSDFAQLMTDCWAEDPEQRPPASEVLARLNKMYAVEKQHLIQERQEHEAAQQQMLEGVQEQAAGSSPHMSPQQGGRMMQGPPVGALVGGDEVRMEQVGHPAAARGANGQLAAAAGAQPGYGGEQGLRAEGGGGGGRDGEIRGSSGGPESFDPRVDPYNTEGSLAVDTVGDNTITGEAGGGERGELDMVEGWGSSGGGRGASGSPSSLQGDSVAAAAAPAGAPDGGAARGDNWGEAAGIGGPPPLSSAAAMGAVTRGDISAFERKGLPRRNENPSQLSLATDSVSTGTLPPTMASMYGNDSLLSRSSVTGAPAGVGSRRNTGSSRWDSGSTADGGGGVGRGGRYASGIYGTGASVSVVMEGDESRLSLGSSQGARDALSSGGSKAVGGTAVGADIAESSGRGVAVALVPSPAVSGAAGGKMVPRGSEEAYYSPSAGSGRSNQPYVSPFAAPAGNAASPFAAASTAFPPRSSESFTTPPGGSQGDSENSSKGGKAGKNAFLSPFAAMAQRAGSMFAPR